MENPAEQSGPFISPERTLPEITPKAVILGIVLSAVLAAANAYLGLFAGLTVSASIPAAVISMGLLRLLRGNILENNIVQTAASAGEGVAAGVIFTLPALVMMNAWSTFQYWETAMIAGFGGILGVLFTIPLRRALIVDRGLRFPEGVATAEVLKLGHSDGGGNGIKRIITAGAIGALFKFGASGLRLYGTKIEGARFVGGNVAYFGSSLSPALIAVGYIVGLNIAVLVFLGGALNWLLAIPIVIATLDIQPAGTAVETAEAVWKAHTRYIGVGAMVTGGLWALVSLRRDLVSGLRSGLEAYKKRRSGEGEELRTDSDLPLPWVLGALVLSLIPLSFIFFRATQIVWVSALMAVIMLVAGFLFSAVAGYMAGLVGSSNNPISGVTIATILASSLLLLALIGKDSAIGPPAAILIGSVVCCAAAIAGDNMQDLKSGHLLGATPKRQQVMQMVGVIASAAVMAPVLTLLLKAYGIGVATAAHPEPLIAPQATLMASVAEGVFTGALPWTMVMIGMGAAVVVIIVDLWLQKRGSAFRTPVLALAVGVYLPLVLSVPILIGGLIASLRDRALKGHAAADEKEDQHGLLFAAGLITGEALVGILIAVPIVLSGDRDVLAIFGNGQSGWPGLVLLAAVSALLYRTATRRLRA